MMGGSVVLTLVGTIVAGAVAGRLVRLLRLGWRVKVSRHEVSFTRSIREQPPPRLSESTREFLASKEATDVARERIAKLTARFALLRAWRGAANPPHTEVPRWAIALLTRRMPSVTPPSGGVTWTSW